MWKADDIRQALSRGELFLTYQPTISLKDGRCVGGEALVRWRNGAEIVPPLEFIPVVENTPICGLLTYWVIDTVAAELGQWLHDNPKAQIGINVPPELLGRGGLWYAAEKSRLIDVVDQIILEITERGVPDQIGIDALNRAVGHGVRIALDDVGERDPNLIVWAHTHIDVVKVSEVYVREMVYDASPERLARFSSLLKGTNSVVIAEGVETVEEARALAKAGVHMAQGWLYSPPLIAHEFKAYYQRLSRPHA